MRILFLLYFLVTNIIKAQESSNIYERAFSFLDAPNSPGGIVAIGKGDSILFKKSYGFADITTGEKISKNTIFDIASVSKQFTCFALMLLEEEGKIDWEDDIRKYIHELPEYGDTIKLRHCAQHTSGLRDWVQLSHIQGYRKDSSITFNETLKIIYNQTETNFPAGEKWEYSNSGYALLAEVINRVTKEGYINFIKAKVFKPAGLKKATIRGEMLAIDNEAYPYNFPTKSAPLGANLSQAYGAASILMSIDDAINWMHFLINPPEQYKKIIKKMTTKGKLNNGEYFNYGYGLYTYSKRGINAIDHDGSWYGISSLFYHNPKNGRYFIIMNNGNFNDEMFSGIDYINDSIYNIKSPPSYKFSPSEYDVKKLNNSQLKMFEGDFVILKRKHIKTIVKNNQLFLISPWLEEYPLYYLGDNKFISELGEIKFKIKNDKVKNILFPYWKFKLKGILYNPAKIRGFKNSDLVGIYYNKDLNTYYEIKEENGGLILFHKSHGSLPLKQIKKDAFQIGEWWLEKIIILKSKGKVNGFKIPLTVRKYGNLTFEKLK